MEQARGVSRTVHGELATDDGDEDEDSPEARQAALAAGIHNIAAEDIASMSPRSRQVIASHCQRVMNAVDEAKAAAPCE